MQTLRSIYRWLVIIFCLAFAFLMIRKQLHTDGFVDPEPPISAPVSEHYSSPSATSSSSSSANNDVVKQRDPSDVAVVDHWFKLKGYSLEGQQAYSAYSDEQLMELMKQGDVTAFDVLGGRYIERNDPRKYEVAEQSIAYGSLNGISRLRFKFSPALFDFDSPQERAEKKQSLKMYLSYLKLMDMRGGGKLYSTHSSEKLEIDRMRRAYGEEPLDDEDRQWISNKAQELYDHYQAERHKLGLGDFDNEMPSAVKEYFGL